jgi:hypothetical protein
MANEKESRKCLICGDSTPKPFAALVSHFAPIDWPMRRYIRGNFKAFGLLGGLRSNVTLVFPFMNTMLNWKYRKLHLVLADGSELEPMCEIPPKGQVDE